ncbi:MAG: hypothetical protein IJI22_03850 [Bacilli bacterium]|nr:hypothetical protein [Bacilli bacterium]
MGVLDKIKNALFEVEYIEVEEPPKKEKKEKVKKEKKEKKSSNKENKIKENKPIAKKVILPNKRSEKVEDLEEETVDMDTILDDTGNIETSSGDMPRSDFKFIDDNDLKFEDNMPDEEPEILRVIDEDDGTSSNIENRGFVEMPPVRERRYHEDRYEEYTEDTHNYRESKPYGVDNSYKIPVHEYGGYERKEEKTYFRPSPIISPIYGILDKNYKKEDVVQKKEVRLSSYSRNNMNVDDIRNKAYGTDKKKPEETKFEVEPDSDDDSLLVDLSDKSKPEVKELTVGDAMEYFQDLGLEYNVDYVDVSKENAKKEEISSKNKKEDMKTVAEKLVDEYKKEAAVDEKEVPDTGDALDDDNDNLFDLIDSMYHEDE